MATLEFALELARTAGQLIKEAYDSKKSVSQKCSAADLVTETDTGVENFVQQVIKKSYPDHLFIGEESVASGAKAEFTDQPTWIIDPIDGTTNFVHSFPYCCISIAYAVNKEVTIAIVHNPILNEVFYAEKGKGAFLNGKPIRVSEESSLSSSLVLTEWGSQRDSTLETKVQNMHAVLKASRGIRSLGSAALSCCLVASGCADAYFEYGIHCWDVAAGELIVREAGGVSSLPHGSEFDMMSRSVLVACSPTVLQQVSACVQKIELERD